MKRRRRNDRGLVYAKIHEGYCARSKKPAINSHTEVNRQRNNSPIWQDVIEVERRREGKRNRSTAKSGYPVARRVAISIGPLASTRTKNEESPIQGLARGDYFGFCTDARRRYAVQKNGTGPVSVSRVRSGNLVFHLPSTKTKADNLFRRMARARKNRGLPLVMADYRTPKG